MTKKTNAYYNSVVGYSEPLYHDSKTAPYVDFRAFDPVTGTLKRKKFHIPARLNKRERKARAAVLISTLSAKLRSGWSPWMEMAESTNSIITIDKAIERYTANAQRTTRPKTYKSYMSFIHTLREYIEQMPCPPLYTYQLDKAFVVSFLDYIYLERGNAARTRNNYLNWMTTFFAFMVERSMLSSNPTDGIRKIKEDEKKRQPLDAEMIRQMVEHLRHEDPYFLLTCLMQYYTLIRPSELRQLRVGDVSVKKASIFVKASISKNSRDGIVGIPDTLIKLMIDLRVLDAPVHWYLLGDGFRPNVKQHAVNAINNRWNKMRKALGWSDCYQFYSLKDSGIRDIANTAGIVTARDQARHTDISTTNKYLKGQFREVPESVRRFGGALDDINPLSDKTLP